ncbi:hypothetical protein Nans01_13150 [Nocardiopsis ansamitocini]|uniref:Uncharacterized protein n=1 Tax=Nocardiopsis ansamitocini TaxID=1670832 RepID=A0A9W6P450_9ACTN|nr:hypothetical protein Nans01_13150 [Nocardiopsis ansamitocini]
MNTLTELSGVRCPEQVDVKHAQQRWSAVPDNPDLFAGEHTLHTDHSHPLRSLLSAVADLRRLPQAPTPVLERR